MSDGGLGSQTVQTALADSELQPLPYRHLKDELVLPDNIFTVLALRVLDS